MKNITNLLIGVGLFVMTSSFGIVVYNHNEKEKHLEDYEKVLLGTSLLGASSFCYGLKKLNDKYKDLE